ncbi:rhomboid family intramembrane serine protease [Chryseobacterium sp. MP_3.2]|uniref:rhomboid family intramembrane serine protease n=1 Tax=Chryseobacterium sp. MP_3.2 TaxID=3071712 RepID=UPI002E0DF5AE
MAVFLWVGLLGIARYFLDFKFHLFNLSDEAWNIFLPMLFTVFALILMRKRFSVLKHKDSTKDNFIYIVICGIVLCALLINSQMYLDVRLSKTQIAENSQEVSSDESVRRIQIKSYFVDESYLNSKSEMQVSGKYGRDLNFNFYFVAAVFKDSLEKPVNNLPDVWFVHQFSERMSNRISDSERVAAYRKFREKCWKDLEEFDFYENSYFLRVPSSDEKKIYNDLILNVVENPQDKKLIFLSPSNGNFNDDGTSILRWFFKIFGIGIFIILFALLFPNYIKNQRKKRDEEDDFKFFIKLLIPSKEFLITPVLIDVNILIFIIVALLGVNPFEPRTEDLVNFGALTSAVFTGEYWRIISSMFMHGGIIHLTMNVIVLGIAGYFSENMFGIVRFAMIYFLSGIIAGLCTLLWHQGNFVGVGASGAIFGLIGAIAMMLILQNNLKETRGILMMIFGYVVFNILIGFISNSDNVAHLAGFISGMIISALFYYFKP